MLLMLDPPCVSASILARDDTPPAAPASEEKVYRFTYEGTVYTVPEAEWPAFSAALVGKLREGP
jgi:hypothetical protein